MDLKTFGSMGLAIVSLTALTLIISLYINKRKSNNLQSILFGILLIETFILCILEVTYVYGMSKYSITNPNLTEILCRLYIVGGVAWLSVFEYYMITLFEMHLAPDKRKKAYKISLFFVLALFALMVWLSLSLPIVYETENIFYTFGGPAVQADYIVGAILAAAVFVSLSINSYGLTTAKKLPIYLSLIFTISIIIVQFITGHDYNALTFIFSLVVSTLYFTAESQEDKILKELEESKIKNASINEAKSEFLADMSHEIRTPMNTILGLSECLINEENLTPDMLKRDMNNISEASTRLLDLVNNILEMSNIELGKDGLDERIYSLKTLAYELNGSMLNKINSNNIDFKIEVDKTIPSEYYGDYIKLNKILVGILNNAMKLSKGKLNIEIKALKSENNKDELEFTIINDGEPLNEKKFSIEYEDFMKIDQNSNESFDSNSLGLIIAKKYIKILGGTIEYKNLENGETRYTIIIPQKVTNREPVGNIEEFEKNRTDIIYKDYSNKKILIVDDNKNNIEKISAALNPYKVTIKSCLSGKECLEKVVEANYDLILLDHMMPGMDGIETLQELKKLGNIIPPVVALTATYYSGIKEKYISDGFADYLSKPLNNKELNTVLIKFFDKKEVSE